MYVLAKIIIKTQYYHVINIVLKPKNMRQTIIQQTCQHLKITWSNDFFQNTYISIMRSYVTGLRRFVAGCYWVVGGGGGGETGVPWHLIFFLGGLISDISDFLGGLISEIWSHSTPPPPPPEFQLRRGWTCWRGAKILLEMMYWAVCE